MPDWKDERHAWPIVTCQVLRGRQCILCTKAWNENRTRGIIARHPTWHPCLVCPKAPSIFTLWYFDHRDSQTAGRITMARPTFYLFPFHYACLVMDRYGMSPEHAILSWPMCFSSKCISDPYNIPYMLLTGYEWPPTMTMLPLFWGKHSPPMHRI